MTTAVVTEQIKPKIVDLFDLLGVEAEVEILVQSEEVMLDEAEQEDQEREDRHYLRANVTMQSGAEFIGKHGNRLQDLTTIVNMFLPTEARNFSVILDINNYRTEREEYIRQIAKRNIEHAALTATEVALEPMLPWERRLVHMVAAQRTDVMTESAGEGETRHVIIKPMSAV